jgi:nitrate/TMAO reductase-like tetraheme cytochrome c subunit
MARTRIQDEFKDIENRNKRWRMRNKNKMYGQRRKDFLKFRYNLTEVEYNEMLKKQNFACAICESTESQTKMSEHFFVDHDHETGEIRGLLCQSCNSGLGYFKDSIDSLKMAVSYLNGS